MNLTQAIHPDDLLLARLTSAKLAKIMHGLLSVGTTALNLDSPADFLTDRLNTPLAFLEVLRWTGGTTAFREQVDQLSDLVRQFRTVFLELAGWPGLSMPNVRLLLDRLGDVYIRFCQLLGVFCSALGMDSDYSAHAQKGRDILDGVFQVLSGEREKQPT